jgi:hypothetical protein
MTPPFTERQHLHVRAIMFSSAKKHIFQREKSMSIVTRAKNIILKPTDEWNVIAYEPATVSGLFT